MENVNTCREVYRQFVSGKDSAYRKLPFTGAILVKGSFRDVDKVDDFCDFYGSTLGLREVPQAVWLLSRHLD